jgi:hypothetical protein
MKKLLLILICLPLIAFGESNTFELIWDYVKIFLLITLIPSAIAVIFAFLNAKKFKSKQKSDFLQRNNLKEKDKWDPYRTTWKGAKYDLNLHPKLTMSEEAIKTEYEYKLHQGNKLTKGQSDLLDRLYTKERKYYDSNENISNSLSDDDAYDKWMMRQKKREQ